MHTKTHRGMKSIGKTGLLAIKPVLNYGDKDLWQLYMVGQQG